MSKINPPYRADHVGSLLRPKALLKARQRYQEKEITKQDLRSLEDRHISEVIKKQEAVGLKSITDGEFRRAFFHLDFLEQLDGVTVKGSIV